MKKILLFIAVIVVGLMFCACSTTTYVPVTTVQKDTVYISKILVDSIRVRDSIYIERKNDTVWLEKYKYVYKYLAKYDTVYKSQVDTVSVAYPVEAQLTQWQKTKMKLGQVFIGLVCAAGLGFLIALIFKIKS